MAKMVPEGVPNWPKITPRRLQNGPKRGPEGFLGPFRALLGRLGASWGLLGPPAAPPRRPEKPWKAKNAKNLWFFHHFSTPQDRLLTREPTRRGVDAGRRGVDAGSARDMLAARVPGEGG